MTPTRHSKISRLPRSIRDELNHRLDNGEIGQHLVEWLNALPEVQSVLAAHFDGRPITEQNLSVWKQGGFQDWQCHEEAHEWASRALEESGDFTAPTARTRLADHLGVQVLMKLSRMLHDATSIDNPVELRKRVLGIAQQLAHLRRADHHAERLQMEKERLEMKKEEVRKLERQEEQRAEEGARIKADLLSKVDDPVAGSAAPTDFAICLAAADILLREAAAESHPNPENADAPQANRDRSNLIQPKPPAEQEAQRRLDQWRHCPTRRRRTPQTAPSA